MQPVCDNAGAVDDMSGVNLEVEGEPAGGRQTIGQVGEGGGVTGWSVSPESSPDVGK